MEQLTPEFRTILLAYSLVAVVIYGFIIKRACNEWNVCHTSGPRDLLFGIFLAVLWLPILLINAVIDWLERRDTSVF